MPREIQLGLGDPPVRRFLYIGQDEGDSGACWYEYDHERKIKTYVPKRAITGYITGLRLEEHDMGRHGMKWKLDILLDAGTPYAIRSGLDTVFTRGVVLALASLVDTDNLALLGEALTFVVNPSTEQSKIVFGSLFTQAGNRVKFEWNKDIDIAPLVRHLQDYVGDGGQGDDDHHDEGEEPRAAARAPREQSPQRPTASGKANNSQLDELRRVAKLKDVDLDEEFQRIYPNAPTIEDLTVQEAIDFRKTLMAIVSRPSY